MPQQERGGNASARVRTAHARLALGAWPHPPQKIHKQCRQEGIMAAPLLYIHPFDATSAAFFLFIARARTRAPGCSKQEEAQRGRATGTTKTMTALMTARQFCCEAWQMREDNNRPQQQQQQKEKTNTAAAFFPHSTHTTTFFNPQKALHF